MRAYKDEDEQGTTPACRQGRRRVVSGVLQTLLGSGQVAWWPFCVAGHLATRLPALPAAARQQAGASLRSAAQAGSLGHWKGDVQHLSYHRRQAMNRFSCKDVVIALVLAGVVTASATVGAESLSQPQERPAGMIFGVPVSASNYYFAKRVSYLFPRPGEEELSAADRERVIWEALILHYESFRRGVSIAEDELERDINVVLKDQQQSFTRAGDHAAYARWVRDTLQEDVELFENQMRYLFQIDKLKQQIRDSLPVTVTEDEMQAEFLNEHHHVGGEFVLCDSNAEADAFYARVKEPMRWEEETRQHPDRVRPFNLITLEAIIDLWGVPKEQIYAFHAMPLGSIGPPMPFGTKQWGVFRLLEKRTGELQQFPEQRASYQRQLHIKQQYLGLKQWIEDLKTSARLQVLPLPAPN